jgi:hypothetical protein
VTDKTGSRLDLLALLYDYSQLQQLTINDCLRLTPFLTGLRVSFLPVTDLVLIYESVTSSTATAMNNDCLTNLQTFLHSSLYRLPVTMEKCSLSQKSAYRTVC